MAGYGVNFDNDVTKKIVELYNRRTRGAFVFTAAAPNNGRESYNRIDAPEFPQVLEMLLEVTSD